MTAAAADPMFFATASLAARLCVSRMTIFRWRISGYLPQPCFAEGKTTIWARDDIENWIASGSPWMNKPLREQALESHGGAKGLQEFVAPDFRPSGLAETPGVTKLLDDFERRLNQTEALLKQMPSECDVRRLADRMTSVKRELATLRGG